MSKQNLSDLLEIASERQNEDAVSIREEYAEILNRADDPKPGDNLRICAIAEKLGKNETEVRADVERAILDQSAKREAETLRKESERLKVEVAALRENAERLKMPDREAKLLRATSAAFIASVNPQQRNQFCVWFLHARGWKLCANGWTHPRLCPGLLVLNLAVKLQIEDDLRPVRSAIEAGLKAEHDRALGLNQHLASV